MKWTRSLFRRPMVWACPARGCWTRRPLRLSSIATWSRPPSTRWVAVALGAVVARCALSASTAVHPPQSLAGSAPVPTAHLLLPVHPPPHPAPCPQVDNGLSVGANLGVLAGFAVATRLLAFLLLYLLARLKWL